MLRKLTARTVKNGVETQHVTHTVSDTYLDSVRECLDMEVTELIEHTPDRLEFKITREGNVFHNIWEYEPLPEPTTKRVTGDDAFNVAIAAHYASNITKDRYGYCCDMGSYQEETKDITHESFYWEMLLYRDINPDNITAEFTFQPNRPDLIDWTQPVTIWLETGDMPETSTTEFTLYTETD